MLGIAGNEFGAIQRCGHAQCNVPQFECRRLEGGKEKGNLEVVMYLEFHHLVRMEKEIPEHQYYAVSISSVQENGHGLELARQQLGKVATARKGGSDF